MENLLEAIRNSKGSSVVFDCPHCYVTVEIKYENSEDKPESIFCPSCGVKEEIEPLDFDNIDFEEEDLWDE
jgi:predicted RNA-binding Zn-ribbon protein involved in translation (DUF1610 family)